MEISKLTKYKKIFFINENLPYNIMALSDRYVIVSRKLNKKEDNNILEHEVEMGAFLSITDAYKYNKNNPVYSILDFDKNKRSSDDLIFGIINYFDKSDCKKCITLLENGEIKLSKRNIIDLNIDWEKTISYNQPL